MSHLLFITRILIEGILIFNAFTFLLSYYENNNIEEKPDVPVYQWIIAFIYEFFISILYLPLFLFGLFDYNYLRIRSYKEEKEIPVILVHPYLMNRGCMIYLFLKLKKEGYKNVYALTINPKFAPIEFQAARFAEMVEQILKKHNSQKFIGIGHSQGGIILRYYVQKMNGLDKIEKLITIGSPNQGTKLGIFARSFNGRQMNYQSDFIKNLNQEIPKELKLLCIFSPTDNMILPWTAGKLQEKDYYITPPLGHGSLIFSPDVANKIISYLEEKEG